MYLQSLGFEKNIRTRFLTHLLFFFFFLPQIESKTTTRTRWESCMRSMICIYPKTPTLNSNTLALGSFMGDGAHPRT
jgi:hypothetical protein